MSARPRLLAAVRSQRVIYPPNKSSDWFTPARLRVLAHDILGDVIDLDPATNARNPLGAKHALTRAGLEADWAALRPRSIWMNPPYGAETPEWVDKLIGTLEALRGARALALVPARPGARWYRRATDPLKHGAAQLLCEIDGRVVYETPDGKRAKNSARWGSALLYWGDDRAAVARALRSVGVVRLGAPFPWPRRATPDPRQLRIVS